MIVLYKEVFRIKNEQDGIYFRNRVKEMAVRINLSLVNQTKVITAASELIRNMLRFANGGEVITELITNNLNKGIKITFKDKGPGISDIEKAMKEGYSTDRSLGLGLPGSKKLVDEFLLKSEVGKGTTITITKWKNARG
jgi:serine/threonine-protein kinase RsbT